MKEQIQEAVKGKVTLDQVKLALIEVFADNVQTERIGLVSGIISSDGEEYISENIKKLLGYAEVLRTKNNFPLICAPDIFSPELINQLEEIKLGVEEREKAFRNFWRYMFKSGYITDVFMTPRWQHSVGSKDEHDTALILGLEVHYVDANDLG